MNNCSVCNIKSEFKFCGNCGQSIVRKPTTFLTIVKDLTSNISNLERSVFYTIFTIVKNPKTVVDNYNNGFRNYFQSPSRLLIYVAALAVLFFKFVSPNFLGSNIMAENVEDSAFLSKIVFGILYLVGLSLASFILYFKNTKQLAHHFIGIIYIFSTFYLLFTTFFCLVEMIYPNSNISETGNTIMILIICVWNARLRSKSNHWFRITTNTIMHYVLLYLVVGVIILLANEITFLIDGERFMEME